MKKSELNTPAALLDLDVLERNISSFQNLADRSGKRMWPMTKTHKSTAIALKQQKAGASGFICGTLDECEALRRAGIANIMYAYPTAAGPSLRRMVELAQSGPFIFRLDGGAQAREINEAAGAAGVKLGYTAIVDCGFHRFGLAPEFIPGLARELADLPNLIFKGISTHPGQAYAGAGLSTVEAAAADERRALVEAEKRLAEAGFNCEMVSSGSTPTFAKAAEIEKLTHLHPGNYVFKDLIQVSLEAAALEDCALSMLATVIARPAPDRMLIDAGAKCLGLDQGGHGADTVNGYGHIKGHPGLEIYGLSEEVGKVRVQPDTRLKVGDRVEIIPNHSCSAANLSSYYFGCRGDRVEDIIAVDIRGNSTTNGA